MKKVSKLMGGAVEKLDTASCLLYGIKGTLDVTTAILKEVKQRPVRDMKPACKQGELFSFGFLPEENETLARICLGSLVETI
jgi:hypothetical protein